MRKKILFLMAVALLAFSHAVTAQSMVEAFMMAQTQMHVGKDGKVEACGMRVLGFNDAGHVRTVFDTSLTLRSEGYGLGKLTGSAGPKNGDLNRFEPKEVYGGWFRKQGGTPTTPLNSYFAGEDPKSKLFVADVIPTMEVLDAIVSNLPIHIAISWREGNSTIYYGTPELNNSQRDQFWACFDDLAKAMKASLQ